MQAVRIVVRGDVQGVGFRWWAVRQAADLGISGWVRNLPGGEVESEAVGEEAALRKFVQAMRSGPRSARVDHLAEQWFEAPDRAGARPDFQVVS